MNILIEETKEVCELSLIDPQTGLSWVGDFVFNAISLNDYREPTEEEEEEIEISHNVTIDAVMSQENYDWWDNHCNAYQEADNTLNETREWERERNEYGECYEFNEYYHQYINGYDFNSLPSAMIEFCETWKEDHK